MTLGMDVLVYHIKDSFGSMAQRHCLVITIAEIGNQSVIHWMNVRTRFSLASVSVHRTVQVMVIIPISGYQSIICRAEPAEFVTTIGA